MPKSYMSLTGATNKPRATALGTGTPPPPPQMPQLGAPQQQQPQPQQQQPQQQPAPSHAQTVAALRHFQIFMEMEGNWLKDPELGKSDYKDKFIDAFTKLVADRIATPVQAIGALSQVPERPFQQRQWVQDNYNKAQQARDIVLAHHAQAYAGQGPQQAPDPDSHISDIASMMGSHYGQGQNSA